ncbi:lactose-binding lectin l-2-like [Argopecten irradians]|uniref:lactose-binding lectin l-2-like n=1 Tax=Argopecten irradians TaxID=31199 RepID=UPI00371A9641
MPEHISSNSLIYTGRKINDQNVWVFHSNGEPVDTSLRTWRRGEPDGGDQSCGCTKMSTDFRMSDCHCTGYSFHFICEKRPSVARKESPPTPPPRDCDSDWVPSREKCYYYSTIDEKTTWATAQSRCQAKGGNLAEIKTDEEGIFVKNNIPSHIGARDILYTGRKMNDEGYWVFASSSERVDTTKRSWAKNEPSGRGHSQECGCTQFVGNLLMHDCYCTGYSVHFICEMIR